MMGMEVLLAKRAQHELVLLDGSFTTPTIYFNQGLSKAQENPELKIIKNYILPNTEKFMDAYQHILSSPRNDRQFVAVPKYTSRTEIGKKVGWDKFGDDRGMLSSILEPGEYTIPQKLQTQEDWRINIESLSDKIANYRMAEYYKNLSLDFLNKIHVVYYRPHAYLPAIRLEMSSSVARTPARLNSVLRGIKDQCGTASIMEPYPLYLADRMVKHLGRSISTLRQILSQHLSENYTGNINDIFLNLHSYRTETGR